MREILFRAKRKDNGEWIEGGYAEHEGKVFIVTWVRYIPDTRDWDTADYYENNPHYNSALIEVIPETVCQYTGMTDRDEKKIFEGDICEFSVFDYNGHDTQYKGVVVYCGSRFMLWESKESEYYGNDGGFDLDWVVSQDDEFEVIGNIF